MADPIAAVVLAAGSSTRMGQNKLLLALEGETLVRRAVRAAAGAGLDPVIVVLGHQAERLDEAAPADAFFPALVAGCLGRFLLHG